MEGQWGFRFPVDKDLKAEWLKAIRWAIPLEPKKTAVVCPTHFGPNDFETNVVDGHARKYLTSSAVPSIFPWNSDLWGDQESSPDPSEDEDPLQESSDSDSDGDVIDVSDADEEDASAEEELTQSPSFGAQESPQGITPSETTNVALSSEKSTSNGSSTASDDRSPIRSSSAHQEGLLQDSTGPSAPSDAANDGMNVTASSENRSLSGSSTASDDRSSIRSSSAHEGLLQDSTGPSAPSDAANDGMNVTASSENRSLSGSSTSSDDQSSIRSSSAHEGLLQDSTGPSAPSDAANDGMNVTASSENRSLSGSSTSSDDRSSIRSSSAHEGLLQDSTGPSAPRDAANGDGMTVTASSVNRSLSRSSTTSDDRSSIGSSSAHQDGLLQDNTGPSAPSDAASGDGMNVTGSSVNRSMSRSSATSDRTSSGSSSTHQSHLLDSGQAITPSDASSGGTNARPSSGGQTLSGISTTSDDPAASSGRIPKPEESSASDKVSQGRAPLKMKRLAKLAAQEKPAPPGKEKTIIAVAPSGEEKTIRKITKFTIGQKAKLEQLFEANQYPDQIQREQIRQKLGIENPNIIRIWFQNRRAQFRREARKTNDEEDSEGKSQTPAEPANVDAADDAGNDSEVISGSNSSLHSDAETQQRLQRLWMYYGSQGCEIPEGPVLEEIAVECGLTHEATTKWFQYANRRFSNKSKKSVATKFLLKNFIRNCYPSRGDLESMSFSTGMEPDEIHNWFRTELYWQTMYFNDDEGNKTSQEDKPDQVPQQVDKRKGTKGRRETPDSSTSEESDVSVPAFEGSSQSDQSHNGNDTDRESLYMYEEDAPEIDLTKETESESTQPKPSTPLWSDSDSSAEISLPNVDPGPNQRVEIQHWVDKLLKRREYCHTEPISEDDDINDVSTIDLTDGTETRPSNERTAAAQKKRKQEDDAHSSDCEIIEPELPMIEIDSDDDEPPKPQTTVQTAKAKPHASASVVPRARKQNLVPRQLSSSPQFSEKSNGDVFVYLDSDSLDADKLSRILKRLSPLNTGSVIKTVENGAYYTVVTAKHSNATRPNAKCTQDLKRPGENNAGTSQKTADAKPNSGKVNLPRKNQPEPINDSDTRYRHLRILGPPAKRPKTDTNDKQISQKQSGVISRVAAGNVQKADVQKVIGQPKIPLKRKLSSQSEVTTGQPKSHLQHAGNAKQVVQNTIELKKPVTSGTAQTRRIAMKEVSATSTSTGLESSSTVAEVPMDAESRVYNVKSGGGSTKHVKPAIRGRVIAGGMPDCLPSQQSKRAIDVVKQPGNNVVIRGVVNAQNGQKIAIIHPSVRQKQQPGPNLQAMASKQKNLQIHRSVQQQRSGANPQAVPQTLQSHTVRQKEQPRANPTAEKQIRISLRQDEHSEKHPEVVISMLGSQNNQARPVLIGEEQAGHVAVPQSSTVRSDGEVFSTYVNLVPEVDNTLNKYSVVTLKTASNLDAHCQFLETNLRKVDYKDRPLHTYKTVFLPQLNHGLIYWGHCPAAKNLFKLQKAVIGAIMGAESATPQHFCTLKLLTLPSMYVLQCLIHVHKNYDNIREFNMLLKVRKLNNVRKNVIPQHERNGYWLYKALPAEMHAMRIDVFIAVLKVFLHKNPLFRLGAYFEAVKSLGSNATQNTCSGSGSGGTAPDPTQPDISSSTVNEPTS